MCVTLPGRVLRLEAGRAFVDIGGRERTASTVLYPAVREGEWVMVAAGTIVDRVSAREARQIRSALRALTGGSDDDDAQ